ncbi:MAG: alpha-amylase family glycosyl hydrolase [Bacteroidales bacterium]|nr:alpha-amylase family glycosyl hydrolase [Bacteroidales bacterium]
MKRLLLSAMGILIAAVVTAQIIVTQPAFPTPTDSVVVIYNAALGNGGLKGYAGDVYAHTGVITNLSSGPSDWKHAPSWGDNSTKYKLTRIGTDLYKLVIKPSINAYYGITTNEKVLELAFVFRSADKSREGKTESNGDIFYPVVNDTLIHIKLLAPSNSRNLVQVGKKVPVWAVFSKNDSVQILIDGNKYKTLQKSFEYLDTLEVTKLGKTRVNIKVFKGIEVANDSFYFFVPYPTSIASLPTGCTDGINFIDDSTVVLCFVAPKKNSAFVIGEFNYWEVDTLYQMKYTPDSTRFWITLSKLDPQKEYAYQFFVDGQTIADPYARKILDPWNDKSIPASVYPNLKPYPEGKTTGIVSVLQSKQQMYNWKYSHVALPEKSKLIIYELLVRDFHSSHSYRAIIDSLNYLKRLGINAIELMPVMEFEGNESWGYNPAFYFAPDKYYGTPEALKRLIDTLHSQGIAVILDIVLNHSFGQCPMVQLYWDKTNNRPSAESPWYNPVAKHEFNVGYDFNHESLYTKQFASQVLKYWLSEYRIDGYRFDLSKGFTQKNTLGNVSAWGMYDASRVAILKAYADTIWKINPQAYVILEHFAENKEEKELTDYGMMVWGNANSPFREASMGWNESSKSDFSWASYKVRGFSSPALVSYMESHDEERMIYSNLTWGNTANAFYSPKNNLEVSLSRAELCALFFLTMPGPKMIWQFGELGYDYSIDYNGRVGNKPIRWDYYLNPNRYRLYSFYSLLNGLRNRFDIFHTNNFTLNVAGKVKRMVLSDADMQVIIVGNFDMFMQETSVTFTQAGWWYEFFSGDSINISETNRQIVLRPGEYRLYSTKPLTKANIISAPQALNVKILGNVAQGNTLQTEYEYFDANGDPEGITKFQWYRCTTTSGGGKVAINGATDKTYTLSENDKGYYIFVEVVPYATTGSLLKGLPAVAYVDFATNSTVLSASSIEVYPNPFSDKLIVKLMVDRPKELILSITDVLGKKVYNSKFSSGDNTIFDLSILPKGIYVMTITDSKGSNIYRKKVVKN